MNEPKRRFPIPHPGVLLVVALVLVVIAVGLSVWVPYQREQAAVREIRRLGGSVSTQRGGPEWLRGLVGDRWMVSFGSVWYVSFEPGTSISDDELKHLSGLTKLQWLSLDGTLISDAELKHLSRLTKLKTLRLEGTQVTNEGVESLQQKLPDCIIVR